MRTNIVLDDKVVDEAMQLSSISTKRELVDTALREFIRLQKRREIRNFRGKLKWQGNLNTMRETR